MKIQDIRHVQDVIHKSFYTKGTRNKDPIHLVHLSWMTLQVQIENAWYQVRIERRGQNDWNVFKMMIPAGSGGQVFYEYAKNLDKQQQKNLAEQIENHPKTRLLLLT